MGKRRNPSPTENRVMFSAQAAALFGGHVAPLFCDVLTVLQREGPMIHILHKILGDFLRKLLLRFMKTSCVKNLTDVELLQVTMLSIKI